MPSFLEAVDLLTTDRLVLASTRSTATDAAENYVIHDEIISKEPLVAYVNTTDMQWANVVRWAIFATIAAEESGVGRSNYKEHLSSRDPDHQTAARSGTARGPRTGRPEA